MIVTIHQPNFLPWLGFFAKMAGADACVLFDTAQFTKHSFQNRVEIKASAGRQWLTVPVRTGGRLGQRTREVEIQDGDRSRDKVLRTLRANYGRAPYFSW